MNQWLNIRYFWIATALMAVLQFSKFMQGETDYIRLLVAIPGGGLFWGVIATFIAKKIKK